MHIVYREGYKILRYALGSKLPIFNLKFRIDPTDYCCKREYSAAAGNDAASDVGPVHPSILCCGDCHDNRTNT